MRIKRKLVIICYFAFFFVFMPFCYYLIRLLTSENQQKVKKLRPVDTTPKPNLLEESIRSYVKSLPDKYRETSTDYDNVTELFISNVNRIPASIDLKQVWSLVKNNIRENKVFSNGDYLGSAIEALRTAPIISADVDSRGTQLKLLFMLEGEIKAVFKPQWYSIDKIIAGPVYAGKDRYNSEIFAFYLSGLLDFRSTPISSERIINLETEILPIATERLKQTILKYKNTWCVYGVCFYCKSTDLACSQSEAGLRGALIYHIPRKLELHRSPWQRKYKGNQQARWQIQNDYCTSVKLKLSKVELLDLVDAAIFDFLIQNGDRHHYETIKKKIVLLDNGKGLGNPLLHHLDILAPLYQCCMLRVSTWLRLLVFKGDNFRKYVTRVLKVNSHILSEPHLSAIEERLLLIYSTVELCQTRFPNTPIFSN